MFGDERSADHLTTRRREREIEKKQPLPWQHTKKERKKETKKEEEIYTVCLLYLSCSLSFFFFFCLSDWLSAVVRRRKQTKPSTHPTQNRTAVHNQAERGETHTEEKHEGKKNKYDE